MKRTWGRGGATCSSHECSPNHLIGTCGIVLLPIGQFSREIGRDVKDDSVRLKSYSWLVIVLLSDYLLRIFYIYLNIFGIIRY
ncbi:hypothetical protein JTE90_026649 [Oedothorax gibbosus]|uniref:Uncharacterized protein n=1 Tax=Oedothorax gibbosus TaxID=931172 RepID=A0AAV6U1R0_9ARAC|nr:hypothetical protein JTE90_026649 [Oedothorax gibbosus]